MKEKKTLCLKEILTPCLIPKLLAQDCKNESESIV